MNCLLTPIRRHKFLVEGVHSKRIAIAKAGVTAALLLLCPLLAPKLHAQGIGIQERPWTFSSRIIMTGSSDHSDPEGYMVFSAIVLEAGISRQFSRVLAAELTIRTQSHEVDFTDSMGVNDRLGSIELLTIEYVDPILPTIAR
jgi:hypothetical protein